MHRLRFEQTVKISVSIDLNDEVVELLNLQQDEINRFLDNRRDLIIGAAHQAAGRKIVELLQAYAEEFMPASKAYELMGPERIAEARERWRKLNEEPALPPKPEDERDEQGER